MRSKNILSIVAFVAAFGLSAAFASLFITKPTYSYTASNYCKFRQNSASANAISSLIAADHANGRARGSKMYDIGESYPPAFGSVAFADYAEAVEEYADASSSMDTENLPVDFNFAWREHMKAWRDYSNFLNRAADISKRDAPSEEEFYESELPYNREITRTWVKVLKIGEDYGANVR